MTYIEMLANLLTQAYFAKDEIRQIKHTEFEPVYSRMMNVARFVQNRNTYGIPLLDNTQLSSSYSDLKDKHCLLKLQNCCLKKEITILKLKRDAAYKRATLYYERYWEIAQLASETKGEHHTTPNMIRSAVGFFVKK